MRLLFALPLCFSASIAAAETDTPTLDLPCMEVLDSIQERSDYAATLIARGVEGVAESSFSAGVLAGIGLGHAIARGANAADAKLIGAEMGETCAADPSLTFGELLEKVSPPE